MLQDLRPENSGAVRAVGPCSVAERHVTHSNRSIKVLVASVSALPQPCTVNAVAVLM